MQFQFLSFTGDLTRARALEQLLGPSDTDAEDCELGIQAGSVDRIDAVTATALRMRIARHLREHPRGKVTVHPPRSQALAVRMLDMLSPLPARVIMTEEPTLDPHASLAIVPATVIPDSTAAVAAGEFAFEMSLRAGAAEDQARFAALAVMELGDNALLHAADANDPPVVAVTVAGHQPLIEVAVTDAGTTVSGTPRSPRDSEAMLKALPGRALQGNRGFLATVLMRAQRAGVTAQVEIMSGTTHLLWTPTLHRPEAQVHVPGFTVVARIGA